jgi:hypothetical protein
MPPPTHRQTLPLRDGPLALRPTQAGVGMPASTHGFLAGGVALQASRRRETGQKPVREDAGGESSLPRYSTDFSLLTRQPASAQREDEPGRGTCSDNSKQAAMRRRPLAGPRRRSAKTRHLNCQLKPSMTGKRGCIHRTRVSEKPRRPRSSGGENSRRGIFHSGLRLVWRPKKRSQDGLVFDAAMLSPHH